MIIESSECREYKAKVVAFDDSEHEVQIEVSTNKVYKEHSKKIMCEAEEFRKRIEKILAG